MSSRLANIRQLLIIKIRELCANPLLGGIALGRNEPADKTRVGFR